MVVIEDLALSDEVRMFIVGDEGLVFVAHSQQLHALNTMACFIWCGLEERRSRAELVASVMDSFGLGTDQASRYVADCLTLFDGWGVFAGRVREPAPRMPSIAPMARRIATPDLESRILRWHRYRLLDGVAEIGFCDDVAHHWVHALLGYLEAPGAAPVTTRLHVVPTATGYQIARDNILWLDDLAPDQLGPLIKALVWQACVRETPHVLNIHAGAVADGEHCILLPGRPGSGKSTLSAALGRSGYTYLSDEVALLAAPDLRVRPVPLAMCVKSTGWDVLAPFYPELTSLPVHRRGDGKIVRYLRPPIEPAQLRASYAVSRIVFPRYVPGCATTLWPLGAVEGLRRLLGECVSTPTGLTMDLVATMVDWIGHVHCAELEQSSIPDAIARLRGSDAALPRRGQIKLTARSRASSLER